MCSMGLPYQSLCQSSKIMSAYLFMFLVQDGWLVMTLFWSIFISLRKISILRYIIFFENLKLKVKHVDFILSNNTSLLEKNDICNNKRDLLGNWYTAQPPSTNLKSFFEQYEQFVNCMNVYMSEFCIYC